MLRCITGDTRTEQSKLLRIPLSLYKKNSLAAQEHHEVAGYRTTHQRVFIIEPDQLYYRTMTPADPCISARPAPEDRILQFFQSPFFLSVTIGIPFCTYKFIFGSLSIRNSTGGDSPFFFLGWLIIGWAALDLAMNVARAVLDIFGRPGTIEYCSIAQIGRYFHAPGAFLAFDTLLSFSIICITLWSGWITRLTSFESFLWYSATTLNLISLSLVIMYDETLRTRWNTRKKQ